MSSNRDTVGKIQPDVNDFAGWVVNYRISYEKQMKSENVFGHVLAEASVYA